MDLWQSIDGYCERLGPAFWAEPLNALSNGAFLVAAGAALILWLRDQRAQGEGDLYALGLVAVVAVVGVGSFLFHTFAVRWSALADVVPIAIFIHAYLLVAVKRFFGLSWRQAAVVVIAFVILSPLIVRLASPLIGSSASYVPALLAIFAVGAGTLKRDSTVAKALFTAGIVFVFSLGFRMADEPLCAFWPVGTHFLWHFLNAMLLFLLLRLLICRKPGYTLGSKTTSEDVPEARPG